MTLQEASLNVSEQEYRDYPCLSYSALSKFDREGYECVETLFTPISTPSLVFGSVVDCLLTQGEEAFNNSYTVMQATLPPESILNVVLELNNTCQSPLLALVSDEDIINAANVQEYSKHWKDATRVNKIRELGSEYYDFLKSNQNKIIIDQKTAEDAFKCVEALKTDPITRDYFMVSPIENREILYQLQFVSKDQLSGIEYKGMLDLVIIDHKNKLIYPCDLKTTKSIYTFEDSFYNFRYYIQAEMYTSLLRDVISNKCPELAEYKIMPYRFIVISRSTMKPVVFEWDKIFNYNEYVDAKHNPLSNWRHLLQDLNWILQNKEIQLPKEWYDKLTKDGVINIKQFKK